MGVVDCQKRNVKKKKKNGICKNKKKWGKRNHQKILNTRFVPHLWGYRKVKEEKEVKTKTNWSGKDTMGVWFDKGVGIKRRGQGGY